MSRKHYEAIAAILAVNVRGMVTAEETAQNMADYFAAENPRFDRERFLEAAGVGK